MKLKAVVSYLILVPAMLFLTQSCDTCDESGTVTFEAGTQFLEITYLVDSNGANYATQVWNPSNVSVLVNENGGMGQYVPMSEDLSDGKIGPFTFTTTPFQAKKGIFHDYVYVVRKDTFGNDTFNIKFYPAVDECKEFWSVIEYYRNGDLQAAFTGSESASLEIRE